MFFDDEIEVEYEGLMCYCCNISINADDYVEGDKIECCDSDFSKLTREETRIVKADPGTILIERPDELYVISDPCSQCFRIVCKDCEKAFLVVAGKHQAYCSEIGQRTVNSQPFKKSLENARTLVNFFPLPLRPFLEVAKKKTKGKSVRSKPKTESVISGKFRFENDGFEEDDFDLMFSNRNDPIVGSFTNHWMF
jgi:hypothetical protein